MTAKPVSLNRTNLQLLAVLFAVSLTVGAADFRWSDAVFAVRQPAGYVHQPPAAHASEGADGRVEGGGGDDYADFDAKPLCRASLWRARVKVRLWVCF